jgi:hypothetical protein
VGVVAGGEAYVDHHFKRVTARVAVFQLDDVENFVLTLKDEVVQA